MKAGVRRARGQGRYFNLDIAFLFLLLSCLGEVLLLLSMYWPEIHRILMKKNVMHSEWVYRLLYVS